MQTLSRLALAALFLAPSTALADSYTIDASHSNVGFSVSHMTVSTVRGTFPVVQGTVEFDPAKVEDTTLDVVIDVGSVDTRDAKRDEHLRGADFFDVATFPTMTFKSRKIQDKEGAAFDVVGDLTLRGVTKEVVLHVDGIAGPVTDPWGNQKAGGHAWTSIDRQAFGVSWSGSLDSGGLVVGDQVRIDIDVELLKTAAE